MIFFEGKRMNDMNTNTTITIDTGTLLNDIVERTQPAKRCVSIVSDVEDGIINDDESNCFSEDLAAHIEDEFDHPVIHIRKKVRGNVQKKSVRFADDKFMETRFIPEFPPDGNERSSLMSMFWSQAELNQIKMDARLEQALNCDISDYIEAFEKAYEHFVCKSPSLDMKKGGLVGTLVFENGLKDGYRGFELFSSLQSLRQRRARSYVKSMVEKQNSHNFDEQLIVSTAASLRWAQFLGMTEAKMAS